jgi:hypothetical protein
MSNMDVNPQFLSRKEEQTKRTVTDNGRCHDPTLAELAALSPTPSQKPNV